MINLVLWNEQPAGEGTQTLPVGNGRLGAMVFGGVTRELAGASPRGLWSLPLSG